MLQHILDFLMSPWVQAGGFGLFLFGYTWVTKVDNVDYVAAAHPNLLQTEKLDRDGQIVATGVQQWKKGADVASAAALPLGNAGNYFDVTGAVTITSIVQTAVGGAAVQAGTVNKLHFDAALVLTHHATDLILPGAANITTVAGDEAEFICYAAGDWRCTKYQRLTGWQDTRSTDSPIFATVKLSALTDGYIPYHVSDAAGLANSGLLWDAANVRLNIGTTVWSSKLHIHALVGGENYFHMTDVNTDETAGDGMLFGIDSAQNFEIYNQETVGNIQFWQQTAGKYVMVILPNGSVLIGATAAVGSEIFRCDGNAYFDHDVSALTFTDRP